MKYVLDANAWIGWIRRNQPKLIARIVATPPADLRLCSVVVGELIYGAEHSPITHRASNRAKVEDLRRMYRSLPYGDRAAEVYGRVRAGLAALGTPIGSNDLMIASVALSRGYTVVTHNTAEFGRVPGLLVEDWQ